MLVFIVTRNLHNAVMLHCALFFFCSEQIHHKYVHYYTFIGEAVVFIGERFFKNKRKHIGQRTKTAFCKTQRAY